LIFVLSEEWLDKGTRSGEGRLGTAPDRSSLVLLAARLILEEALEGEVRDEIGRERYERADGEAKGCRNGYRPGQMKTAEGMVEFSAPQVRDTSEPFLSTIRENLAGRTQALSATASMPNTMPKSPDQAGHLNRAFPANPCLDSRLRRQLSRSVPDVRLRKFGKS
jgi:hypothetical protein